MGTLTDDDLLQLLGEAGSSYAVPEDGPAEVLEELEDADTVVPLVRRRWVQLSSAAAVVAVGVVLGVSVFGGDRVDRVGQLAGAPAPAAQTGGQALDDVAVTELSELSKQGGRRSSAESGALFSEQAGTDRSLRGGQLAPGGDQLALSQQRGTADFAAGGATSAALAPAGAAPAAKGAAPAPAAPIADGARVVKKGAIALIVDDGKVTPTLTEVSGLAKAAGGDVASSTGQESGPTPSGSVTLRVPVASFEAVVAKVRALDAEVRSATTSGQDVTAQYADLEAQLKTLQAARERFLEILSRARTIGDVLAVQQRVDDVTGKIDRLEGQRRVLAAQSDDATLEVTVTERDDPAVKVEQPDTGLSKAFSDAWHGFTTGVEALIRLSGRGVLLVLCLAVAFVVLRLGWRLSRRRLV